jgi:hypothetical protein
VEVDPEVLRAFAGQVDIASGHIREADVGSKVATAAGGSDGSTTRGAGNTYEVTDAELKGSLGKIFRPVLRSRPRLKRWNPDSLTLAGEAIKSAGTATGKYFGPGVSVATSLWDVAVPATGFQKCVATTEGVTSVTAGALAGIAASETGPLAIPIGLTAALGGEALGNWIGSTFCPR